MGASVLAAAAALTVGTFGIDRIMYAGQDYDLSLTAPGVLRSLLGAAVFLGLLAVIGTAMGWLLRSTAGAVGAMLGLLYGLPIIGLMIPDTYAVGHHPLPAGQRRERDDGTVARTGNALRVGRPRGAARLDRGVRGRCRPGGPPAGRMTQATATATLAVVVAVAVIDRTDSAQPQHRGRL